MSGPDDIEDLPAPVFGWPRRLEDLDDLPAPVPDEPDLPAPAFKTRLTPELPATVAAMIEIARERGHDSLCSANDPESQEVVRAIREERRILGDRESPDLTLYREALQEELEHRGPVGHKQLTPFLSAVELRFARKREGR